jgi:hypothetical protein
MVQVPVPISVRDFNGQDPTQYQSLQQEEEHPKSMIFQRM